MSILNLLTSVAAHSRSYSYNDWDLEDLSTASSSVGVADASVWVLISLVLAVVGGILAYCLFVKKKDVQPIKNKFLGWLKTFLKFDTMVIEDVMKIVYMIMALFLTLSSFAFIGESFLTFLAIITLGNLSLRITFEMVMMVIMIWRNTTEIKNGITKKEVPAKDTSNNKK